MTMTGNLIAPYDPWIDPNPPVPPPGVDNRIINPCAKLAQSTEGASVSPGGNIYMADGWMASGSPFVVTYQRSNTTLGGCSTAATMTVVTTGAPASTAFNRLVQNLEAAHLTDLKYGTAGAKNLIVDFCAQASTPGTYGWALFNLIAARPRSYAGTYTIAAANVPQCYSFSVPGDTVQALTGVSTNAAMSLAFDVGSGSNSRTASCNSWVDGLALTCSSATSLPSLAVGQSLTISASRLFPETADSTWAPRTDDAELALAQEFYAKSFLSGVVPAQNAGLSGAFCIQNTAAGGTPSLVWQFPQQMRIPPVITTYNPSAANANWRDITANTDVPVAVNADGSATTDSVLLSANAPVPQGDTICIHATANARL